MSRPDERLAYFGGKPHRPAKVRPTFTADALTRQRVEHLVTDSMLAEWYGGQETSTFEAEFAAYHGVPVAVAVNSGTSALHAALVAAGVSDGDEVVAPTVCYFSAISAILQERAIPVLYDSEPRSILPSAQRILDLVTEHTRAVMVVHLYGVPMDVADLRAQLSSRGIALIEDCSQAHGAVVNGHLVGTMGDFGCYSLASPRHHISVGEGGVVMARDPAAERILRQLVNRGKNNDWGGPVRQGFSYALPEFSAIAGRQGLADLGRELDARKAAATIFDEVLHDSGLVLFDAVEPFGDRDRPGFYRKLVRLPPAFAPLRDWFVAAIEKENVSAKPPHPLAHQIPWIVQRTAQVAERAGRPAAGQPACPNAEAEHAVLLDLETGPGVGVDDARLAAEAVKKVWEFIVDNPEPAKGAAEEYGAYRP
ncbi:DegT/DnrJ/EryC1/StrS family aminotransferase [Nonomuraea sp. NPDC050540]|uniref:DegT/DnrJ/EryC1/StrS family aminotransferase n=1 Tax=Nonomuraea sp. NPDC050540 TaxID=3364367 RepID=UPI0037B83E51